MRSDECAYGSLRGEDLDIAGGACRRIALEQRRKCAKDRDLIKPDEVVDPEYAFDEHKLRQEKMIDRPKTEHKKRRNE